MSFIHIMGAALTVCSFFALILALALCKISGAESRREEQAEAERWERLKAKIRQDGAQEPALAEHNDAEDI